MLFSDVVDASARLASTRSRKAKISIIAELLRACEPGQLAALTAFLAGRPRQGRVGTGWRTLAGLDTTAADAAELTVDDVDGVLTELVGTGGQGSARHRSELLGGLFSRATERERHFLFRLLTGELRQGALEGVVLDAIASAAEVPAEPVRRAFMLSGTLSATAEAALSGGIAALDRFGLELGRPIRPMLAAPAESLPEALATMRSCVVEYKLDGARIQVHRDGERVHVYTRTLREITDHVGELAALVRSLPCDSVVLDGETLALTDDGRPRPFQETMSRFGSTRAEQVAQLLLRPYFFDCLHLDGRDLLDAPLAERRNALHDVAGEHVLPWVTDPTHAQWLLDEATSDGHEGVMVKDLEAPYAAGRRGSAWLKVKPVHTMDLVVLAAEWGHGRRTGYLSNLHLGARDPDGGQPVMVGKTFKGLTDELLAWQTEALQGIELRRTEWTVWVRPELVVEVELDGVQSSKRYPGGIALRFARIVRYRPDKPVEEADTIDTLTALMSR